MNFSDSEIVSSVLTENNFTNTKDIHSADIILLNTCSVRENAEDRIRKRVKELYSLKKKRKDIIIGIIGCMAERLKEKLLEEEKCIDMISGPDAYRDLPELIRTVEQGSKGINTLLSAEETYADINPVRIDSNGVSAFISIMRGCENFCSYCVVPYTRGKERSRNPESIIKEAKDLFDQGFREITLLGQNVNSYKCNGLNFAKLIEKTALINPLLRIRFTTSHPKDLSDELLHTIAKHENICRSIHLPVQSGSNNILKLMNRKCTKESYMGRIEAIKKTIPGCAVSTDIIAGFCNETEEDHEETLSLMGQAGFDFAFMFKYSVRQGTAAAEKYEDNVPDKIKTRRLEEIIKLQQELSHKSNLSDIGKTFRVLADSISKKSENFLSGRNSQNKVVVFPKGNYKTGDYVDVKITKCTSATLIGEVV